MFGVILQAVRDSKLLSFGGDDEEEEEVFVGEFSLCVQNLMVDLRFIE